MKPRAITRWLEDKNLSVVDACQITGVPVPTLYRLLAEEEQYGHIKGLRMSTVGKLVAGSSGHLSADDLLVMAPAVPARRRARAR